MNLKFEHFVCPKAYCYWWDQLGFERRLSCWAIDCYFAANDFENGNLPSRCFPWHDCFQTCSVLFLGSQYFYLEPFLWELVDYVVPSVISSLSLLGLFGICSCLKCWALSIINGPIEKFCSPTDTTYWDLSTNLAENLSFVPNLVFLIKTLIFLANQQVVWDQAENLARHSPTPIQSTNFQYLNSTLPAWSQDWAF